jgi:ribose transport system ATP-binding protein
VQTFAGTQTLRGISIQVQHGEIVALLGINGAGKSILIKGLGGIHKPVNGQVNSDGKHYIHSTGNTNQKRSGVS